ncbi:hypothetical protein SORBI_3004G180950 [Sorghum bicolor]|jgi:hypothetical protein|uniref:Uncharacterized protein n=1 Tax=Sorghum bicolor TaxID=4558 RepID=A0A1Z5RN36_SORBI|nr:hypothetical protein SORBI_3004G180950 [Sorghum bicolor]
MERRNIKKKGKWENAEGKNTLEHLQEALYMAFYHKLQNFKNKIKNQAPTDFLNHFFHSPEPPFSLSTNEEAKSL